MISIFSGINFLNLSFLFFWALISSLGIPGALVAEIAAGALANNFWEVFLVIVIVAVGSIFGDLLAYEVARKFSPWVSSKLIRFKFFREEQGETRKLLRRYEFFSVFFTRFIFTGLDAPLNYIAGFEKLNRKKFIFGVIFGEILYATIYTLMGFFFKEIFIDLSNVVQDLITVAVLILIVVIFIYLFLKNKKKKRSLNQLK